MSIGKLCSRVVATAAEGESVEDGAKRMVEYDVGTLVVVDADKTPRGIVTDRDVVVRAVARDLSPAETPLSEVMSAPVHSAHEDTALWEALRVLSKSGTRRLVVTGGSGVLAGILSLDDVITAIAEETRAIGEVLAKQGRGVLPRP